MVYETHNWVVVKVDCEGDNFYKLVASVGWGLNDWRINSGITEVVDKGEYYEVFGCTGSSYICEKGSERVDRTMEMVLDKLAEHSTIISIDSLEDKYLLDPN